MKLVHESRHKRRDYKGLTVVRRIVEVLSVKRRSTGRLQGLRKLPPDLIIKAWDETATQVTRLGLTFVGTAAFCLLSLLTPDSALLGGSEKINVPLAGSVSFFGFMLLGPALLIALRVYLQIYVEHSDRLNRLSRSMSAVRAPTLIPLQNPLMRIMSRSACAPAQSLSCAKAMPRGFPALKAPSFSSWYSGSTWARALSRRARVSCSISSRKACTAQSLAPPQLFSATAEHKFHPYFDATSRTTDITPHLFSDSLAICFRKARKAWPTTPQPRSNCSK